MFDLYKINYKNIRFFIVFLGINLFVEKDIDYLRKPNLQVYIPIKEEISFNSENNGKVHVATLSNVPFMENYKIYCNGNLVDKKKYRIFADYEYNRSRNNGKDIYKLKSFSPEFKYKEKYTVDYYVWLYGPWFVMDEEYLYFAETRFKEKEGERGIWIFKIDYKNGKIILKNKLPVESFGPMTLYKDRNILFLLNEKEIRKINVSDLAIDENFNIKLEVKGSSFCYCENEDLVYLFGEGEKYIYKIEIPTGKIIGKFEISPPSFSNPVSPNQICCFNNYIIGTFNGGWDYYRIFIFDKKRENFEILTPSPPVKNPYFGNPYAFLLTRDINKNIEGRILSCFVLPDGQLWIRCGWMDKGDVFLKIGKFLNGKLILPETEMIRNFKIEDGVGYIEEDIEKIKKIIKEDAVILFDINASDQEKELAKKLAEQLNLSWVYSGIGYLEGNGYYNILAETSSIPIVIGNSEEPLMKKFLEENFLKIYMDNLDAKILYFSLFPTYKKSVIFLYGKTYKDREKVVNFLIKKLNGEIKREDAYIFIYDAYHRIYYWQRSQNKEKIFLKGARREYLNTQIGITAFKNLKEFSVETTDLKGEGGTIPKPQIRYVGFVPKKFTEEYLKTYEENLKTYEIWYFEHQSDPLFCEKPEKIQKNKTQPIWLTYYIPEDTSPGIYKGEIYVKAGNVSKIIPVEVEVRDFTLPKHNPLPVFTFYIPEQLDIYLNCKDDEEWFLTLKNVAKSYGEHGQTVGIHVLSREIKWVIEPDGYIKFDYSLFDRVWKMYEEVGMGKYQILGKITFPEEGILWNGKRVKLNNNSLNVKKAKERFLSDLISHLEKMGWKEKAVIYVIDEPHDYDLTAKLCSFYNKLGIKTMAALNYLNPKELKKIEGKLNIWIPQYQFYERPEVFEYFTELLKRGEEVWWYGCSSGNPDMKINSFLTDIRYMVWATFKYKLKGIAIYGGGNRWGPYGEPPIPPNLKIGDKWIYDPYTFTTEGLNFNVYPDYKNKSIVDTIRSENLRDSFQDYMYLWILEKEIKDAKKKGKDVSQIEKKFNEILALLIPTIMPFGKNKIEDYIWAKEEISKMIIEIQKYSK